MQFRRRGDGSSAGAMQVNDLWFVPMFAGQTDFTAVAGTSATFGATLLSGSVYVFAASTDCWIAQGASPTAAKAAGSMFVAKGQQVLLDGSQGPKLAVVQDAAAGAASLVEVTV